ncbi:hypothetical protein [Dyella sp. A6]|uniref:hypothetical protein n=1 Tax=Dyella aluminiiresistens TaxID=3069105 RepID=UPI002E791579|nr:hypothetical protein [Dyella sp. A6]
MPFTMRTGASANKFSVWRIVLWLVLLLSAFGCLQYVHHAQGVWALLHANVAPRPAVTASLHQQLAWDIAYLLAAFVLIVLCAGGILQQAWSRVPLQVAAVVLAAWSALSGVWMFERWHEFVQSASDMAVADGTQATLALQALLDHARRSYRIGLGLKFAAIPVLAWLAWRLGQPQVRAQFHRRR